MMKTIIELPDGYNGHTAKWFAIPTTRDGDWVRIKRAEPGMEHVTRPIFAPKRPHYHPSDPWAKIIEEILKAEEAQ